METTGVRVASLLCRHGATTCSVHGAPAAERACWRHWSLSSVQALPTAPLEGRARLHIFL